MLHNRYEIRGGEDESTDAECSLLRDVGYEVELLECNNSIIGNEMTLTSAAMTTLWSKQWYRRVDEAMAAKRYDVLHVQNFFPLISPSVYYAAAKHRVPVVQSIRNYRLICPAASLFREGKYCTDCVDSVLKLPAIRHACYRGSKAGTGVLAGMIALHTMFGTWRTKVNTYVAISQFVRDRLIEGGFPAEKITVKPNFAQLNGDVDPSMGTKDFILYVGRITREKGADLLLEAYRRSGTNLPLKIIGAGDLHIPRELAERVILMGKLPLAQVYAQMREALCVVMPGAWPEPFGRVAVEAFANGAAVIASDIAGCSEIIEHERTGWLFPPGDMVALASLISRLSARRQDVLAMGATARLVWAERYSPQANVGFLTDIYDKAVGSAT